MLLWTIFVCAKLHLSLYYFKFIVVIANIKLKSKKYIVLCKVQSKLYIYSSKCNFSIQGFHIRIT